MTISVKHAFASAKSDSGDPTLIQPSNWNAEHVITAAGGKVLGRDSSSAGAIQELPLAFDPTGQSMIPPLGTTAQRPASPSAAMIRYNTDTGVLEAYIGGVWTNILVGVDSTPTGAVKGFLLSAAPTGWVAANGNTVGNGSSGATNRANVDTANLFNALWALDPTVAPIYSGGSLSSRGGSAATDFAANKHIVIPDLRGVHLRGLDGGRGLDAGRLLGSYQADLIASHNHTATTDTQGSHNHGGSSGAAGNHTHGITLPWSHGTNGTSQGNHWSDGDTGGGSWTNTTDAPGNHTHTISADGSHTHNITVNNSGGAETRGKNVALLMCVKL